MNTFMLILTVLNIGGSESTFVVDLNLSAIDCAVAESQWNATLDEYTTVQCEEQKG